MQSACALLHDALLSPPSPTPTPAPQPVPRRRVRAARGFLPMRQCTAAHQLGPTALEFPCWLDGPGVDDQLRCRPRPTHIQPSAAVLKDNCQIALEIFQLKSYRHLRTIGPTADFLKLFIKVDGRGSPLDRQKYMKELSKREVGCSRKRVLLKHYPDGVLHILPRAYSTQRLGRQNIYIAFFMPKLSERHLIVAERNFRTVAYSGISQ